MPSTCSSTGTNIVDKTLTYDALGNISTKSDVGTYGYTGAGPHAVTSVTGSYLGLTNPVIGYDLNGNMTCVSTASSCGGTVARTATYTSFNMAQSVTAGSNTLCLTYNSEHQRITQVQTTATCASPGSSAITTTYLNDPITGAHRGSFRLGRSDHLEGLYQGRWRYHCPAHLCAVRGWH